MINRIIKKYFGPKPLYVVIDPPAIPHHIKEFSKMFPISTEAGNRAVGEIKILQFKKHDDVIPGRLVTFILKKEQQQEWWVYLGYNFFKLLYKK